MPKKFLMITLLLILYKPAAIFARDPYPTKLQVQYIVPPHEVENPWSGPSTDPETMIRTDNQRADIISFSCYKPGGNPDSIYYNDPSIDSSSKVNCQDGRTLKSPYLKNNKQTVECTGKEYDINCYDWPIGQFLGRHSKAAKGGSGWGTPIVYDAQSGYPSLCGPQRNEPCDCPFTPHPANSGEATNFDSIKMTFVDLSGGGKCVAPPYAGSGIWWDWLVLKMLAKKNELTAKNVNAVGVYLGIDGEGRPFKSDSVWGNSTLATRFNNEYVPAVIAQIKSLYPGKTIRSMTDEQLKNLYLNNDIDFHRESLASDEVNAYLYKGLPPFGWWQGFANYYWVTNSLGLGQGWHPFYQSLLGALSKHTDAVTGIPLSDLYQDGKGDFLKFAGSYIGKDINNTPGVWINLRDTMVRKMECFVDYNRRDATIDPNCTSVGAYYSFASNYSGKYGDYDYYLYRPEGLDNNHTVKVSTADLPAGTKQQIYNFNLPSQIYPRPYSNQYVGRKVAPGNRYISFDIDDGYRYVAKSGISFDVRVVYLDTGTETFKFQYKNHGGNWQEREITKTNTNLWQETKFTISDAFFNNNASEGANASEYPTDFRLDFGNPPVATTIHLTEVRGRESITPPDRPKAQVGCDIVRNESDNPLGGIESVGLNQIIKVKAQLTDSTGHPLHNERIMVTYNTEWNWAKSAYTNSAGVAFVTLNTANNIESGGFMGADASSRPDKPSQYSVQVFYPGNNNYQPSRNDCVLLLTNSSGPNDPNNSKLVITGVNRDANPPTVSYQVRINPPSYSTVLIDQQNVPVTKSMGFYPNDPNAQTVQIVWTGLGDNPSRTHHASFNNITLNISSTPPFDPSLSLKTGWNTLTLPHPAYTLTSASLPSYCKRLTVKPNSIRWVFVRNYNQGFPLQEGNRYNTFCSQNTTW